MISFKTYLLFALAATPALSLPLERRANAYYTCHNTAGSFRISRQSAERNIHAAPLVGKDKSTTGSGYPHHFQNRGQPPIVWANSRCNDVKDPKNNHYLLEFPVFPDGRLYNWNSHPKDGPGPARAIFTYPGKDFCGVISHTNGNDGNLVPCV